MSERRCRLCAARIRPFTRRRLLVIGAWRPWPQTWWHYSPDSARAAAAVDRRHKPKPAR